LVFEICHFLIIFLAEKVVFLVSKEKNEISSLVPPPGKIFVATSGKIHYFHPLEKLLLMPMTKTIEKLMCKNEQKPGAML